MLDLNDTLKITFHLEKQTSTNSLLSSYQLCACADCYGQQDVTQNKLAAFSQ